MAYETIIYTKEGGIGIITLNRPQQLNAVSPQMATEVTDALKKCATDSDIGVVIITGGDKVFSAGADLEALGAKAVGRVPEMGGAFDTISVFFTGVFGYEKPLIAAVSGFALGGGCELAMQCDFRIASTTARFGVPEIKVGLIPGGGGTQTLPRLIGVTKAKEMLLIGDPVNAEEAYRLGLVNKVVPVESLMDEAKRIAKLILERPAVSIRAAKRCVDVGMQMDLRSAFRFERQTLDALLTTEDAVEGVNAFREKRKPKFVGR